MFKLFFIFITMIIMIIYSDQDELLFMTNPDITNTSTAVYTGLSATLIPDADYFYTDPSIADLVQIWTVYNLSLGYNVSNSIKS